MNRPAPRSIDEYLRQLREALSGEDPALVQDALYDAEEYLRAEVASHSGKSEADVLELIASTYGAPEEVAAAYRDTEIKVKAAFTAPKRAAADVGSPSALRRFFSVFSDVRAYTSLFLMLLALPTGILYFTFAVTGLSLSFGLAILIIGIPFFLTFIGVARVISLGEGRLIEAMTGERMPRRPAHPGAPMPFMTRVKDMLADVRTWTTLAYFVLKLPIGIANFVLVVVGLTVGMAFTFAPIAQAAQLLGWIHFNGHIGVFDGHVQIDDNIIEPAWLASSPIVLASMFVVGVLLVTTVMHMARGLGKIQARVAKSMLVTG